jgi:SRSO17 transposase
MSKSTRPARAPEEPLDELMTFLNAVGIKFGDRRRAHATERYVTGLLTDHPNKNCDTLAQILPGTSEQRLQALLTTMDWDAEEANRKRVELMTGMRTEGDGVLILDPTDFPKQGQKSVGVARQYSGSLGKVANCQVTVNCHYAERTIAWPVASQLYLPEAWAQDAERRKQAHVPKDIDFQSKADIALGLIDQANQLQVRHVAVVADAEFGDNPQFLDGLEARHERYVVDVRRDFQVSAARQAQAAVVRAEDLVASWCPRAWHVLRWREGTAGWLTGSFAALRCYRVDGRGKRTLGWLIAERELPDGSGRHKLHWSNFPASTPLLRLVELVHRRAFIELYHEDAKTLLGWDQYQGRLWTGFHRNTFLVMLAYSFLVWTEWQERQRTLLPGRPRGALSPPARPAAEIAGIGAAADRGHAVHRSGRGTAHSA